MRLSIYPLMILCCLSSAAVAGIAREEVPPFDFDVTSYINGSYNYLERSPYFTSGLPNRANDLATNGARLQQLFLSVGSLPETGLGGYLEMAAGLDAYSFAPSGWNADMLNLKNVGFAVPDFYVYYGKHDYTLIGGVFESIIGFEAINYLKDTNFSRGIIYQYVVPGVHWGLRGSKQVNDAMQLFIGLSNGWSTIRQPGRIQAVEINLQYQLTAAMESLFSVYAGNQYLTDFLFSGPTGRRVLLDWTGTYNHTKQLSFNWELDYATQNRAALPSAAIGSAVWTAAAGFVNYQFNDRWRTSVRGEIMNDRNGYRTGVSQVWKEATLSFGYEPIRHLSFILETRHDFSNVNAFVNRSGNSTNNNQQSYALEALYQFV